MGDRMTMRGRDGGEASIEGRLRALGRVVPPPEIAEIWVFPPLAEVDASAEFFLFTRFQDGERRALYSARLLPENGTPARQVVVEHGSVPADRVPRLVGRLQRRLGEDRQPRHAVIDGEEGRWEALLGEAGPNGSGNGSGPTTVAAGPSDGRLAGRANGGSPPSGGALLD